MILRSLHLHLVRADVLRDSTGFLFGDARFANGIEQRCLTVIDVTHDRDDRRARKSVFRNADFDGVEHHALFERDEIGFRVEVFRDVLWPFLCRASG